MTWCYWAVLAVYTFAEPPEPPLSLSSTTSASHCSDLRWDNLTVFVHLILPRRLLGLVVALTMVLAIVCLCADWVADSLVPLVLLGLVCPPLASHVSGARTESNLASTVSFSSRNFLWRSCLAFSNCRLESASLASESDPSPCECLTLSHHSGSDTRWKPLVMFCGIKQVFHGLQIVWFIVVCPSQGQNVLGSLWVVSHGWPTWNRPVCGGDAALPVQNITCQRG